MCYNTQNPFREGDLLSVNIAYFLTPKNRVVFLYDDNTFRQGLEKMRHHGYTAVPVISRDGRYVGTVSEGNFLWRILDPSRDDPDATFSIKEMERLKVRDILRDDVPPVGITASVEKLVNSAMKQNFVPVVDDLGRFIGIVTRKDVIRCLAVQQVGLQALREIG